MSQDLKPCKLYDDHKSNINFLIGRVNPLFVEVGAPFKHTKRKGEINSRNVVYIIHYRADNFNVTATELV